jgi:autotransporter-associated beta strand protein
VPTTAGGWNTYWIEDGVKHEWQTVYDTTASVASLGSISIAIVAPVNGNWTNTNSGTSSWSTASNWNGGVPTVLGDTATFGAALTSGTATVTLDGSRTLSGLTFSNTNGSYAIAAGTGGTLTLAGTGGASAALSNSGGSHSISAPIALGSNLAVTAVPGSTLTISGAVTENAAGTALSLGGGGTLVLAGASGYSGGTAVANGTLDVSSAQALPSTGVLVAGRSGLVVLGNSLGSASLADSSPVVYSDAAASSIATAAVTVAALSSSDVPAYAAATTSAEVTALVTAATTDERATLGAIASQPASVARDAVFNGLQSAPVIALPLSSEPTEAIRVAALGGVVLPSTPLSKVAAVKPLFALPPKATLVAGVSMDTQRKIAALIDAVPAASSPPGVAAIITPPHGSFLGRATTVHRGRSTLTPGKSPGVLLLARLPDGISHRGADESSAGA